jgi:hypothetical protein
MTMFDERERAFEAKWAHDEEMQFRILMRRNELLGLWAGKELGLNEGQTERYVADLVALTLRNNNSDALFLKLRTDLGVDYSDAVVRAKIGDCLDAAMLDAGLEQRSALGAGKADIHRPGEGGGDVPHVNFAQVFAGGDAGSLDQEGGMHFRMLRKISMRSPD